MHTRPESTPEWLNNSFLRNALKSYKRDETIEVLNFDVRSGFCEHFASSMFQSKIEFKSSKYPKSELSVVIKAEPIGDDFKEKVVASGPLFDIEIQMYNETLPAIHQLFERNGLKAEVSPE